MSAQEVAAEVTRREVMKMQQAELEQRIAKVQGDPAKSEAAEVQAIQRRAVEQTHVLAERADEINDEYVEVLDAARAVRASVTAGMVTPEAAVADLRKARNRLAVLGKERDALRKGYEDAQRVLADPAAEHNRLRNKYPALR